MRKVELIFTTFVCVMLAACGKHNTSPLSVITEWPVQETIEGTRIDLPLNENLTNMGFYAGDYLVFNTFKAGYCLQVYDRDFNLIDTAVTKGQGPEELPTAMFYGQWNGSDSNPELLLYCEPLNRISKLTLNSQNTLSTVADIPTSSYLSPSSIYQVSDTLFVGVSLIIPDGAQLFKFNSDSKQSRTYPLPFEFSGNDKFYTTQQSMAYNPVLKQYCTAYSSVPWIVIYDEDFNVMRKIAIGEEVNTSAVTTSSGYSEMSMVRYCGNHIMVMYWEKPSKSEACSLLVLDSEGNPEGRFDIGDAIGYIVDSKASKLLTIHHDKEEDVIYLRAALLPEVLTK